ncbi:S8 family serine peptidase [Leptolyngbya sp. AN02str]|uniref:S8 family serine peptidase n=1 Tax=Leptolyngbya sp. AN02str TaxID=3423363 RepID=UPI003D310AE2
MSTNLFPSDPLFNQQWYLLNTGQTGGTPGMDLNVVPVWNDYTGQNITVAILDDGVDYTHSEINDNYNMAIDYDATQKDSDPEPSNVSDNHGTSVAGIIGAEKGNGEGGIGVAPEATLAGIRMDYDSATALSDTADALNQMASFDIVNNSWGYIASFSDNFLQPIFQPLQAALVKAVATGRNGRGTVIVFAGGNNRSDGDSANYHNLENSRFTIAVAALNHVGSYASYSSPGANLLVSAFGGDQTTDNILTIDRVGSSGYTTTNYETNFGGTSASAPMVSGVVALMLQANPRLGYRDVQTILAYTARQTDATSPGWALNGATNWNGGGLHVSHDYGFGLVNALAAVRLAETWTLQHTLANEQKRSASRTPNLAIPDLGSVSDSITIANGFLLEHVEVTLELDHTYIGDLTVTLTSPKGTQSILLAKPPASDTSGLKYTFSSTHYWGESSTGQWTLAVRDDLENDTGMLKNWTLNLYGSPVQPNTTYVYTDEFGTFADDPRRSSLSDTGGVDTLNAAAVTNGSVVDLAPGSTSLIAGQSLSMTPTTVIEHAVGGDGNDVLRGNAAVNWLRGGRGSDMINGFGGNDTLNGGADNDWLAGNAGNDVLQGANGNDTLWGGVGNDTLTGNKGGDRFVFQSVAAFNPMSFGLDTVTDFVSGSDRIVLSKTSFAALKSIVGYGFSIGSEFASVANDGAVAGSAALIVHSQTSGRIFYNANGGQAGLGSGAAFAVLSTGIKPLAGDFILQA